ncbi:hypothetical protein N7468_007651 [Penicillium chermesinum]|uniref:Zn(2)-C6 fungal-type domain-containing protein n=1 Tax=Penicillium chermesinum TaxID=63820 RepID=A0A9W9NUF8_9EURO|nr:uncharacterized protein N7468_007651 [Penicillium chermesinum]KAJ5226426.1 hypothetical protein N7468_007651 [Penicillium chermesinum]KAJ6160391.1 hypothetical protein N7470_003787 [Penicillium chermesinum]
MAMYEPPPPRQKQTNITRTRSGCKECRKRHVKCDEGKPACGACVRRNKTCEAWEAGYHFRNVSLSSETMAVALNSAKPRKVVWKELRIKSESPNKRQWPAPRKRHDKREESIANEHASLKSIPPVGALSQSSSPSSSTSSPTPSLTNFDIVRSLNRSENETFYLTHWDSSCSGALDHFFQEMTFINDNCLPLKHAILALSACNMSRLWPENGSSLSAPNSFRPHGHHQTAGQSYYTSAVSQVARIISNLNQQSPIYTLAVLVIFCYIEASMGTFTGFACHADGIETFFQINCVVLSTDIGHRLYGAYLLSKYQNWWRRQNFTSFYLQRNQPSLRLSEDIVDILRSIDAKRALMTSILCELYRLNTIGLLQIWESRHKELDVSIDSLLLSLDIESKRLDDWEAKLSPGDLPSESPTSFEIAGDGHHSVLVFGSHWAAMNYAYYIAARIMHCLEPHPGTEEIIRHWMTILVRLVAGLDTQECISKNVYSIGISSLLMACVLRCQDISIGRWVENWLRALYQRTILEEGSFPVAQALATVTLINKERQLGNEVYAIGLPEDDGGGSGKYSSYNSQLLRGVLIKGKKRETKEFFSVYRDLKLNISSR